MEISGLLLRVLGLFVVAYGVSGCGASKEVLSESAKAPVMVSADVVPLPHWKMPRQPNPAYRPLSEQQERAFTAKAEQGDKNAAALLWDYYLYGCANEEKAAYFLNIAGRGGPGVGQYNIGSYNVYVQGKKHRVLGGYMNDKFILSEELIQMLEPRAERDDGEAAFRLYQHFRFVALNEEKARHYLILSAKHGHPTGMHNLKSRYSETAANFFLEQYSSKDGSGK